MVVSDSNSAKSADESTSGAEVVRFIRTQSPWIVGSLVAGAVLGFALSYHFPRQWEASLVLQIGQVEDSGAPVLVDPPSRSVERIAIKSFKDQILRELSLPVESTSDNRVRLIRKTLRAEVVPNTDLINVSVREYSPTNAKATLQVVESRLVSVSAGIVQDAMKRMKSRLDGVDMQIATLRTKVDRADFSSNSQSQDLRGGQGAVNRLLGNMLDVSSASLLMDAEGRRAELLREMSPNHTYNTKPIGDIAVSTFPVAPRRGMFAVLGAMFGLFGGLLIGGFRWMRGSTQNRRV